MKFIRQDDKKYKWLEKNVCNWITYWHFFGRIYVGFRWRPTSSVGERQRWGFNFSIGPTRDLHKHSVWVIDDKEKESA
jgi:hypothetical protein